MLIIVCSHAMDVIILLKRVEYRMDIATADVRKDSGDTSVINSVTVRMEHSVSDLLVLVI